MTKIKRFKFGHFLLEPMEYLLSHQGKPLDTITGKNFDILVLLVERHSESPNALVSKDELGNRFFGNCDKVNAQAYTTRSIHEIRKGLGDGKGQAKYIATVRGEGYRFVPPVQAILGQPSERAVTKRTMTIRRKDWSWLYDDKSLARVESRCIGDSIWIISPDLANVTGKKVIVKAVTKNIQRGIAYTYIVPDSDCIRGVLPGLKNIFASYDRQFKLIKLDESEFRLLSVREIAVLNATMKGGRYPEVYMELPIEEEGTKDSRGYWIRVAKGAANDLVGRFRKIVEEHQQSTD